MRKRNNECKKEDKYRCGDAKRESINLNQECEIEYLG